MHCVLSKPLIQKYKDIIQCSHGLQSTKSFQEYRDDGVYIERAEVSVRLTCAHKHYRLPRDVRHGDCSSHLRNRGDGTGGVKVRSLGLDVCRSPCVFVCTRLCFILHFTSYIPPLQRGCWNSAHSALFKCTPSVMPT